MNGCPYVAGPACPGCDGECWAIQQQPEPTIEDCCAAAGHAYYGDHDGYGRCYCGWREYPVGG